VATGKGRFSADIGEDVIAAALDSVEQHTRAAEPADGVSAVSGPEGDDADAASVQAEPQPDAASALSEALARAEARVRELEGQVRAERDTALRGAADLDNARKRAQRDLQEGVRFANERLLKDFLPVVDNLERALSHGSATLDWASLEKGLRMTQKQFEDTLGRHGVKPMTALGQPFDPNLHEAMGTTESEGPPNTVVSEVLRGWTLHDRVVRPALVSVSKPKEAPAETQASLPAEDKGAA
jgi:molecular chaperone GrpE